MLLHEVTLKVEAIMITAKVKQCLTEPGSSTQHTVSERGVSVNCISEIISDMTLFDFILHLIYIAVHIM